MPQNQPGQGRTVMPSRLAEEKKPYIHQSYPSTRFHPDGRVSRVENEADEQDRCPVVDGWAKTPFPAKPQPPVAVVPEASPSADVRILVDELKSTYQKTYQELLTTHKSLETYSNEQANQLLEVRNQMGLQANELAEARKQLAETRAQLQALAPAPEETAAAAGDAKKKK